MEVELSIRVSSTTLGLEKLKGAISNRVNSAAMAALPEIDQKVQELVRTRLQRSHVFTSLLGGILREELGIFDAEPAVTGIIQAVLDGIKVELAQEMSRGRFAKITIKVLKSDFSDVLAAPGAEYISVGKDGPRLVQWLEWLLFRGSDQILVGYRILYDGFRPASRTGEAIMIKGNAGWGLSSYPYDAGTQHDNFLTRSLEDIEPELNTITIDTIREYFH